MLAEGAALWRALASWWSVRPRASACSTRGVHASRTVALGAALLSVSLGVVALTSGLAQAQTTAGVAVEAVEGAENAFSKADLRARQAELFAQLQADPDNLDLMFAYAAVSARAEDVEQAIATFERMLIYRSDLSRVRLELGALYFRIGSYEASRRYLISIDQADGEPLPAELRDRADAFLAEIASRTRKNQFFGEITAGGVYSTNATLGPDTALVLAGGEAALIEPDAVEQEAFGARVSGRFTHTYDLGRANSDVWRTDLVGFALRYDDASSGDVFLIGVRSGPRLSLDDDLNGLKIQPFAETSYLNVGREPTYFAYGGGFALDKVLDDRWYAFGEVKSQFREYFDGRNNNDGFVSRAAAGAVFSPSASLSLTGVIAIEREGARVDFEQSTEAFARLSATYVYNPGVDFVDRNWTASGFVRVAGREFDAPDPSVDPDAARTDIDVSIGAEHDFALQRGFSFVLDADYLLRESDIENFDLENLTLGASVRYKF